MKKAGPSAPIPGPLAPNARSDDQIASQNRVDLATEAYSSLTIALRAFGVSAEEQEQAKAQSIGCTSVPAHSGPLLRDARGLSNLLQEWTRAPDYTDRNGAPRVLKLKGKAPSFESLVNRFLPNKGLSEALAMAQSTTEIELRPRNRIALIGSVLVKLNDRIQLLALAVRHVDQLLSTSVHNMQALDPLIRRDEGRMERMVTGVILRQLFPELMAELRPQIYDLLQRVDSAVERRAPKTPDGLTRSTSFSIGIYVSQEDDWQRAGIDPTTVLSTEPDPP